MPFIQYAGPWADVVTGRHEVRSAHRSDTDDLTYAFIPECDESCWYEVPGHAALRPGEAEVPETTFTSGIAALATHNASVTAARRASDAAASAAAKAAQEATAKAALDAAALPLVQAVEGVLTARQLPAMNPTERASVRDAAVYLASRGEHGAKG